MHEDNMIILAVLIGMFLLFVFFLIGLKIAELKSKDFLFAKRKVRFQHRTYDVTIHAMTGTSEERKYKVTLYHYFCFLPLFSKCYTQEYFVSQHIKSPDFISMVKQTFKSYETFLVEKKKREQVEKEIYTEAKNQQTAWKKEL